MSDNRFNGAALQGYEVPAPWGGIAFKVSPSGKAIDLPSVRSVGVDNLCDVQSHTINRIANSTSHVVRFIGGGHVQLAYNDQGDLLDLRGAGITIQVEEGGRLLFGPYRDPSRSPADKP